MNLASASALGSPQSSFAYHCENNARTMALSRPRSSFSVLFDVFALNSSKAIFRSLSSSSLWTERASWARADKNFSIKLGPPAFLEDGLDANKVGWGFLTRSWSCQRKYPAGAPSGLMPGEAALV